MLDKIDTTEWRKSCGRKRRLSARVVLVLIRAFRLASGVIFSDCFSKINNYDKIFCTIKNKRSLSKLCLNWRPLFFFFFFFYFLFAQASEIFCLEKKSASLNVGLCFVEPAKSGSINSERLQHLIKGRRKKRDSS